MEKLIPRPPACNDSSSQPKRPVLSVPVAPDMRDLIDTALNTVMEQAAAEAGLSRGTLGRCADYALVGARVLSVLLDHPYEAMSGGEIIDCGSGLYVVLQPGREARRRARKLSDLRDYHCWIEACYPMPDGSRRRETIDFTMRHDRLVAEVFSLPYTREQPPSYLWEWQDQIAPVPQEARAHLSANGRNGAWMWADKDCQRLLKKYDADHQALLDRLAGQVLHALMQVLLFERPDTTRSA